MIYDLIVQLVGLPSTGTDYDLVFQILAYCFAGLIVFFFIYQVFNFFYLMGKKIFF